MSANSVAIVWAFLSAGLGLVVILFIFGAALIVYQRRFLALHRGYAEGLLSAQESERAWVAREIHDDALQRIQLVLQELDDWAEQPAGTSPSADGRRDALRAELEDLSAVLRRMAYRLHPSFVAHEGIVPMLERLAADVDRSAGVRVEVRDLMRPAPSLTADQSLVVYRIAQEALTNIVRHAGSLVAIVEVSAGDRLLEMRVEDYGAGFDPAGVPPRGLGLISMSERARSAGGMLSVVSHPGGGTRVHLRLPVGAPA